MSERIKAFKGFDAELKCKDFQYKIGEEYIHEGAVKPCTSGFHACRMPMDTFTHYRPLESRFNEVEQWGNVVEDGKVVSDHIRIGKEIGIEGIVRAQVKAIIGAAQGDWGSAAAQGDYGHAAALGDYGHAAAQGDYGHAAAQGDYGHAAAQGNFGHAAAQGDYGHAAAQGDFGHAAALGYRGRAAAQGDFGHAAALGYWGHAVAQGDYGQAVAQGDYGHAAALGDKGRAAAQGEMSIAMAVGAEGRAKAALGSWIVCAEWKESELKGVRSAKVDGKKIKENTWYVLKNGKLVEPEQEKAE